MDRLDTHPHLIPRDRLGYAWRENPPTLVGSFTPDDYGQQMAGHGVLGTIFMKTGVEETDYRDEVVDRLDGRAWRTADAGPDRQLPALG